MEVKPTVVVEETSMPSGAEGITFTTMNVENHVAGGCPPNPGDELPRPGMVFQSEDVVRQYYERYAYKQGFAIRKASTKGDSQVKYYSLACARGGKHVSATKSSFNPRPSIKTDCKAKINVVVSSDGTCTLSRVCVEHNHALNPKEARLHMSHKSVSSKRRAQCNDQAKVSNFSFGDGEYRRNSFGEKDGGNITVNVSQLRLGPGDAPTLCEYFLHMQKRNSNFFYAIDMDDLGRLRNALWVDARSKAAYESFGDVVLFDNTYLSNKYEMPLVTFVGANHHGQPLLFGCGLLSGNDIESYIWMFRAWLKHMRGHAPNAIITDECRTIQAAIAELFPHSHHRLCLWHIMRKLPEYLGALDQYETIKRTLKSIVYESVVTKEFDENWCKMIVDYNLVENEWLSSLFLNRSRWVPVYVKQTFWAGMSILQRGEKMSSFFDEHVNSKTSLKRFLQHYDDAMKSKVEKENKADYDSMNSTYKLITGCYFEKQFQDAYTNSIFKLFQDELRAMLFCNFIVEKVEDAVTTFKVTDILKRKDGNTRIRVAYSVRYNEAEFDICCSCHLFESKGIVCRHITKILIDKDVKEIPPRYILTRWRKGIKHQHYYVTSCYEDQDASERCLRFDALCSSFSEAAEIAAGSTEMSEFLLRCIDEAKNKLKQDMNW